MGLIVSVLKRTGDEEQRCLVMDHGQPVEGPFFPTEQYAAVLIDEGPTGIPTAYDAVWSDDDDTWLRQTRNDAVGPMAGGRWLYTTDGRFPGFSPVSYHDRWETRQQYDANFD